MMIMMMMIYVHEVLPEACPSQRPPFWPSLLSCPSAVPPSTTTPRFPARAPQPDFFIFTFYDTFRIIVLLQLQINTCTTPWSDFCPMTFGQFRICQKKSTRIQKSKPKRKAISTLLSCSSLFMTSLASALWSASKPFSWLDWLLFSTCGNLFRGKNKIHYIPFFASQCSTSKRENTSYGWNHLFRALEKRLQVFLSHFLFLEIMMNKVNSSAQIIFLGGVPE